MKHKIPLLLTLLIVTPIILLAWLGARVQRSEQIVVEHQAQQLANAQLRAANKTVDDYISSLEQESLIAMSSLNLDAEGLGSDQVDAIRAMIEQDPMLEQVFILSASGQRQFPPFMSLMSRQEELFVQQTQALWDDAEAFRPKSQTDLSHSSKSIAADRTRKVDLLSRYDRRSLSPVGRDNDSSDTTKLEATIHGWTSWDVGSDTQTFFWFRDASNNLVGQKLAPAFWTSELINRLPDDRIARELIGNARIKLVDKKQRIVYQWGAFEDALVEGIQPLAQRFLSQPLDGWRLEYYAPQQELGSRFRQLILFASLFALALVLTSLGVTMWREYRRDMRTAAQRVTFVNQVSHELKTPLTNICMYADMLESELVDEDADAQRMRKYSQVVRAESERLGRLINNVLSFSSAQQKGIEITISEGVIDQIVRDTVDVFKPAYEAKNIAVELDLNTPDSVKLDTAALEQILNNLLSNIEKYAAAGRYASIRSSYSEGVTRIDVCDHGEGLDAATRERIFEPFVRGSSRLNDGVSGTGIGLSIARQLCRAHGGDLVSVAAKKGACFVITLATPRAGEAE